MIKTHYLIKDSLKQLVRTKGIFLTFILSVLVSVISFFCYFLFLFFNHIHQGMVEELEKETDFISVQMGMAPIMGMLLFKIGVFILAVSLFLLLILYIKKSFIQFLLSQQEQLRIRYLLGESKKYVNGLMMLQMALFTFFSMLIGSLIGSQVFQHSIIKTLKLGIESESINSFNITLTSILLVYLVVLSLMLASGLSAVNKKTKDLLDFS